jgi:hypothetical protein
VDQTLPIASRVAAVASLGGLPGMLDDLADWAGRPDDVIAEAALDALSHSEDALGALRVLLAHGGGLASSTAVAAMGRCCADVPASSLGVLLGEALTGPGSKVTVRKQAARLLERHRPPGAPGILLRAWRDPDLHRDARVAVAVALRHLPATSSAFEALDEAAERYASEPMLRTLFQAQPWEYAPEHRPRYAALVWRLLNAAQAPGVRFRGIGAFRTWVHWYEGGTGEILTSVADPGDPAGARDLSTFLSFMHAGLIHDEVPQVIERLLAGGRDAEARRRLSSIVGALLIQHRTDRYRDLSGRVAALLAGHPLYLGEALRLDVHYLPVDDDGAGGPALAEAFVSLAGRLRDRPVLAARVSGHDLGRRLRVNGACRVPPKDLLSAARRLLDESHLGAELLALALAGFAVPEGGPGEDLHAILDRLRGSAHLDVAIGAWEIESIPRG